MRKGVLNTDCTDYTDKALSPVMRSVFEHGFHGLYGFFSGGRGYSLEFRGA